MYYVTPMFTIHYFDTVNLKDISFQSPKKVQNRYRSAARYGKDKLLVQSPRIQCSPTETNGVKYLDITVDNKSFLDFLVSIDELCINTASANSLTWFGRKINEDTIRNSYRSPLSVGRNGTHLTAKLQYDEYGEIATRVFDEFANEISMDEIYKKPETQNEAIILELNGFWFGKSAMRCEWSVVQIKQFQDETATVELQADSETEEDNTFFSPDEIIYDEE